MENNQNEEIEIDLREIFFALKRRILLILAVGLLGGCLSCAYTMVFVVGSTAYQRLSDFNYQYACFGTGH